MEEVRNTASNTPVSGGSDKFVQAQAILSQKCASCHSTWTGSAEAMIGQTGDQGKGSTLVTPGDLNNSSVYQSLLGPIAEHGVSQMPLAAAALSEAEIQTVGDWILSLTASDETTEVVTDKNFTLINQMIVASAFDDFVSVIQNKCVWCHKADSAYLDNDDYNIDSPQNWIDSGFIVPGDADASRIVRAMEGSGLQQMPPNGLPGVSAGDLTKVKAWINSLSGGGAGTTPQERLSAARDILTSRCTSCHADGNASGGLRLDYTTDAQFINAGAVQKGDPDTSLAYMDLKGVNVPNGEADMPRDGTTLNAADISAIKVWIELMP